jgi:hypothetical protein
MDCPSNLPKRYVKDLLRKPRPAALAYLILF